MTKITTILSFFFLFSTSLLAQEMSVKRFEEMPTDLSARTQARQDLNGNDCALVKVQVAASGVSFSGDVVGDYPNKGNEYWVYMPEGSKHLKVHGDDYLPLDVVFADHGIPALKGRTTYVLTLLGNLPQGVQQPKVKTGWLVLTSEPPGASVFVDDEYVGNTPLTNYKQAYGSYSYKLELPNYHAATGTVELNTPRLEKNITLMPAFGTVTVSCNVSGAKVLLDGKDTGKTTPCTIQEVASGQHVVSVQMEKYAPMQQNVVVEDGQTARVNATLKARFAQVTIQSLSGAQIYCNGEKVGTTRYSDNMMEGFYDLEARLAHHQTVSQQIQVTAGQPQELTLNPVPIHGSLDVVSTPHDADVTIDGKAYGKTPLTVEQLLEGEHQVSISKDGYGKETTSVKISENETANVTITLKETKVNEQRLAGNTSSTTRTTAPTGGCPDSNHPHMIDLGLPSGTKWACCNVGADKPEGYGGYYAWGETSEKKVYDWTTYKHCNGNKDTCHNLGSDIAGTQYDVAHVKWGGGWRMPTKEQQDELRNNCTYEWTTSNGVKGGRFTSKKNGRSIFLPAAGYRWNGGLYHAGSGGSFWSSTQYSSLSDSNYYLYFGSGGANWSSYDRYYGRTVRPLCFGVECHDEEL